MNNRNKYNFDQFDEENTKNLLEKFDLENEF